MRKVFRFEQKSNLCQVTAEVTIDGKPVPNSLEWRGGFGDLTVSNAAANQRTLHFGAGMAPYLLLPIIPPR